MQTKPAPKQAITLAGYSGTPLQKKLGLKPGYKIYLYQPPGDYFRWIAPLPDDVDVSDKLSGKYDFVHLFVKEQKVFRKEFVRCEEHLKKDGMLWISWPKKSSKVVTDLDENNIREFGLQAGMVDVKVCAIDEVWSGLKFVFRLKDR